MDTREIPFEHRMAAHCETGTVTALLNHGGLTLTEPLVFGIAGGIFFGYLKSPDLPFPMFILRSKPGNIRRKISKRLGIKFAESRFKNPSEGEAALDKAIRDGHPTAVQVDFFYMDYMPEWQRVHINAHYVIVCGVNGSHYTVSDSYYKQKSLLERQKMLTARFAGGMMAPKGMMFYTDHIPEKIDLTKPIITGIKRASFNMTRLPIPFLGIKGIHRFAEKVKEWPALTRDADELADRIMRINILLEDQGTGGGGFRYMYATFLQQAAPIVNDDRLKSFSKEMMEIGDKWRNISYFAAKISKNRDLGPERFEELSRLIHAQGDEEQKFFSELYKLVK
ncbi:MAG TPA: BtrH N-terminal domain-containing protein [Bacteroidales bacterium]|nr:BtrH N-terminal domain-containing protein [Bacteroidales bacterium]